MLGTVEGTFKEGKVQLKETPDFREAKVRATFLSSCQTKSPTQMMRFGQFAGPPERMSTSDDFRLAEWCGETHDGD